MKNKKIFFLLLCLILTGCSDKTYTITFDTSGGSTMNSIEIKKGDTIKDIEEPTKEGYLFVNWLKDGLEYNSNTPITEDMTLTASWIEAPIITKEYTVSFVTDEYIKKVMVEENKIIEEPSVPEKEKYLFLGWFVGDEKYDFSSKVTKDIILTAKYELDTVTITYDLDGGFGLTLEIIPRNTSPSIPDTPTKEGYRFLKWTLEDKEFSFTSKIAKDITLKAIWEEIEYITITYDTDGGEEIKSEIIEKYSKIIELPTPTKEGYTFKEWQLDNQTFNPDTTIQNDIILKAIYN